MNPPFFSRLLALTLTLALALPASALEKYQGGPIVAELVERLLAQTHYARRPIAERPANRHDPLVEPDLAGAPHQLRRQVRHQSAKPIHVDDAAHRPSSRPSGSGEWEPDQIAHGMSQLLKRLTLRQPCRCRREHIASVRSR